MRVIDGVYDKVIWVILQRKVLGHFF